MRESRLKRGYGSLCVRDFARLETGSDPVSAAISACQLAVFALNRQSHLQLRVRDPLLRYGIVGRVNLNPDEVTPSLHASNAGCTASHEWVKDGVARI